MRSDEIRDRVERSYERYEWTTEQRDVFDKFINEQYANYENPKKTVCAYQDTLNQVVVTLKNPFFIFCQELLDTGGYKRTDIHCN